MAIREKYIGESKLVGQPKKKLTLKIKENTVGSEHLKDGAVTPEKVAPTTVNVIMQNILGDVTFIEALKRLLPNINIHTGTSLPLASEEYYGHFFLLQSEDPSGYDHFDEYICIEVDPESTVYRYDWEYIGRQKIDLSNYVSLEDLELKLQEYISSDEFNEWKQIFQNDILYLSNLVDDYNREYIGKFIPKTEKGAAWGVATLDDTKKVEATQLPENVSFFNNDVPYAALGGEQGDATTADFNAQTDTVWHKPQILSMSQKAQARENIGAVSQSWVETFVEDNVGNPFTYEVVESLPPASADTMGILFFYNGMKYITKKSEEGGITTYTMVAIPDNQVQANWAQTDSSATDYIKNKPTLDDGHGKLPLNIMPATKTINNESIFGTGNINLDGIKVVDIDYDLEDFAAQGHTFEHFPSDELLTADVNKVILRYHFTDNDYEYNRFYYVSRVDFRDDGLGYLEGQVDVIDGSAAKIYKIEIDSAGEGHVDETIDLLEQVQADWNQSNATRPDFIKNKPVVPFIVNVDSHDYADKTFSEIATALSSGRPCFLRPHNIDYGLYMLSYFEPGNAVVFTNIQEEGIMRAAVIEDNPQSQDVTVIFRTKELAGLHSPNFTGTPQVPTPGEGSYSKQIANTKWVKDKMDTEHTWVTTNTVSITDFESLLDRVTALENRLNRMFSYNADNQTLDITDEND